jgi:cysteine desulfurase
LSLPIYLDYNGTTPHHPRVIAAMRPFLEDHYGNPSSTYAQGRTSRAAVEKARAQVANLIGAQPDEILFTSGGTESNNHALRELVPAGAHFVTTAIEHPAILDVLPRLERTGAHVTIVPVNSHGQVDPGEIARALQPNTALVSVMHANNEVGTLQPLAEISALLKPRGILFHTDAAQSLGRIPVHVDSLGVDLLTIAGHKLYCPKGIGALYIRTGVKLNRFFDGAGQEQGRRAGTENVLHIAGLGEACALAAEEPHDARPLRDLLEHKLLAAIPGLARNGHATQRLPNTTSLSFPQTDANHLLAKIAPQVAASAGAACHSGAVHLSHVLRAMGVPPERGRGTLRFSTGRFTTEAEIDEAVPFILHAFRDDR